MVGPETVIMKPSRSDEVLDPDQQMLITNQVRAQFDSMVPKRPAKPNRSDPDFTPFNPLPHEISSSSTTTIPELDKLQFLRSQDVISGTDNPVIQDEFVETQYYKELDSIDKQHHTTGSGFIKMANENGADGYEEIRLQRRFENGNKEMICKSNPATNDWVPCLDDHEVGYVSSKPNRSENC